MKKNTLIYIRQFKKPALVLNSSEIGLKIFFEGRIVLLPPKYPYRVIPKNYTTYPKHKEYLNKLMSNYLTTYYEHIPAHNLKLLA